MDRNKCVFPDFISSDPLPFLPRWFLFWLVLPLPHPWSHQFWGHENLCLDEWEDMGKVLFCGCPWWWTEDSSSSCCHQSHCKIHSIESSWCLELTLLCGRCLLALTKWLPNRADLAIAIATEGHPHPGRVSSAMTRLTVWEFHSNMGESWEWHRSTMFLKDKYIRAESIRIFQPEVKFRIYYCSAFSGDRKSVV